MKPKVFISYHRHDSSGHAGRLVQSLKSSFLPFHDLSGISAGEDWLKAIVGHIRTSQAMLCVIGPRWKASEIIQIELKASWEHEVPTFPVLVDGACMPRELPEILLPLTSIHAAELTDSRWDYDVRELTKAIRRRLLAPCAP